MPSIQTKVKALDGEVIQYAERRGWYYRSYSKATRSYTLKLIPDAVSLEDALSNAYKVLVALAATPTALVGLQGSGGPKVRKRPKGPLVATVEATKSSLTDEVEAFLRHSEQRVAAGLKDDHSHKRRCIVLRLHFLEYLSLKGITKASQLEETTFDDYMIHRKGISKHTLRTELKEIGIFIRYWLVRHKHITNDIGLSPTLIPKVRIKQEDLDSNPSISPHDYKVINEYIRKEWIGGATHKGSHYYRHMFHTFTHLLKNSGCRPKELLHLRYKDVTITNPKRWSNSQGKYVDDWKLSLFIYKSKTGKTRTVLCRSNAADNLITFLKYQRNYNELYGYAHPKENDLVFGKPQELYQKTYSHRYLDSTWRDILNSLGKELQGNPKSDKEVTLYSLRTTFIEDCVADGIDIYTVAKLCGNSVKIIEHYYDTSDVVRKAKQIQHIERGVRKAPPIETFTVI